MTQTVIKLQAPLMSNDPVERWLAYERGRKHQALIVPQDIPKAAIEYVKANGNKAYFHATRKLDRFHQVSFEIGAPANTQVW